VHGRFTSLQLVLVLDDNSLEQAEAAENLVTLRAAAAVAAAVVGVSPKLAMLVATTTERFMVSFLNSVQCRLMSMKVV